MARAQYVPIPAHTSGSGCPNDITQCGGYQERSDINARFSGAEGITPHLLAGTTVDSTNIAGAPAALGQSGAFFHDLTLTTPLSSSDVASAAPSGSASGDLGGSYPGPTVTGLHFGSTALSLSSTAPSSGQYLYYNGTSIAGTAFSLAGTTSMVGFDFVSTPVASAIEAITCAFSLTIPTNFGSPNSVASCGQNPGESDAYTVKINGSTVGTLTLNTSCVLTRGTAAQTTCSAGQRLEIDAPATVSGKDIAISLAVTR